MHTTLGDHHLTAVGLDPGHPADAIVDTVRTAVQRIHGADWIDVEVGCFPPTCPGWVTLYPCGSSSATPDTPPWHALRCQVEETVKAALVVAAAPV
jgi:hypothetical protein